MPSLKRMKKMDYSEAWGYFMESKKNGVSGGEGLY